MNEKQQQLTFDKGITNVPSDALCSDNALAESVGMVYDDGEHRVIQKPEVFINEGDYGGSTDAPPTLLLVHKFNNEERFIGTILTGQDQLFVWGVKNNTTYVNKGTLERSQGSYFHYTGNEKLTTIGKTMMIADDNGLHYFLWTYDNNSNPKYEYLGDSFPLPDVEFVLENRNTGSGNWVHEQIASSAIIYDHNIYQIRLNGNENWNNSVIGLYSKLRKKLWQKKRFVGSFCIRAALELYDGTYYHITNPIFMLNQFSAYCIAYLTGSSNSDDPNFVTMELFGQELKYRFYQDYTKWADIIKNVVLFVTRESDLFDTLSDAIVKTDSSPHPLSYFLSGNRIYKDNVNTDDSSPNTRLGTAAGAPHIVLESIPDTDLENKIKEGVYYKLCEIGLAGNAAGDVTWHSVDGNIDTHTLENLTTKPQLGEDDYYSNCPIKADYLYSYNSRLNLAGVSRGFFDGYDFFMPFVTPLSGIANQESTYTFHVTIRTDGGDVTVGHTKPTNQIQGIYFFYPDSRARHVKIWKGTDLILDADLTEHPTLNGAFYFAGITPSMEEPSGTSSSVPQVDNGKFELLANYVIQSEVNNPFVFKAAGYFKVGTGKILGMSSITQALSEGQFGQFPLLVFSESGIWALSVGTTGYYTSIHPMSREVALLDNPCITQTDGAVFFASKKGLMVVVGNQVKCVSEQLSGRTNVFTLGTSPNQEVLVSDLGHFCNFLKTAIIAYDYRDSLLWLFNKTSTVCYVYSIKSGTFSKYDFGDNGATPPVSIIVDNVVNNYPDYLLQAGSTIMSLTGRDDINIDTDGYTAKILTRPMKFEDGLALKSLRRIRNIKNFAPYTVERTVEDPETHQQTTVTDVVHGTIALRIFVSNNLDNWAEVHSLTGTPWKYFRFLYNFTGLKATDRFSGAVIVTQERRTDKIR